MSKKHHQRTRAEILARRAAPSTLPAPIAVAPLHVAAARRYIAGLHFTAATRRAMRSEWMPHEGAKQLEKSRVMADRAARHFN